jgi:hypothetical protein
MAYVFGWSDPKVTMYDNTKMLQYAATPMKGWLGWRWRVVRWNSLFVNPTYETVADNLTKKQAEGLVKLMEGIRDECDDS